MLKKVFEGASKPDKTLDHKIVKNLLGEKDF